MIKLRINSSELIGKLKERIGKLEEVKPQLLADIGDLMVAASGECFEQERGPDGEKWAERAPSTMELYKKMSTSGKNYAGNKILQFDGQLKQRVGTYTKDDKSVAITSRLPYSRVHQFGFRYSNINTRRTVTVPARPYMGFSKKLKNSIRRAAIYHLQKTITGGK